MKKKNKIVITFEYDSKGELAPTGMKINTKSNTFELILAAIRLWEIANDDAKKATGEGLVTPIRNAIACYVENIKHEAEGD